MSKSASWARWLVGASVAMTSAAVGLLACGGDDAPAGADEAGAASLDGGIVYQDGGPLYRDGGVVYTDGGVAYRDGGFAPFDAGPSACSDAATSVTPLGPGLYGCGGAVEFHDREDLCAEDFEPCSPFQLLARRQADPTENYWLDDELRRGASGPCNATGGGGISCGTTKPTPMRVCVDTGTDPEGNTCNWRSCGIDGSTTSEHFGGCEGDFTAGALCCPSGAPAAAGCASGTNSESFGGGMVGCAGKVEFTARATLCAAGYHSCTAAEWVANRGGASPAHNYWTNDNLRYGGSVSACTVSTSTGTLCAVSNDSPMRVCGAGTSADPHGNRCLVAGCTLEGPAFSAMGGCDTDGFTRPPDGGPGYDTAGTLCCAE